MNLEFSKRFERPNEKIPLIFREQSVKDMRSLFILWFSDVIKNSESSNLFWHPTRTTKVGAEILTRAEKFHFKNGSFEKKREKIQSAGVEKP